MEPADAGTILIRDPNPVEQTFDSGTLGMLVINQLELL